MLDKIKSKFTSTEEKERDTNDNNTKSRLRKFIESVLNLIDFIFSLF